MKAFGGISDISYFLIITLAEMEDKDLLKFKLLSGNKVSTLQRNWLLNL